MTRARVGHIDFLNVLPLSYAYKQVTDFEIVRGVPAELNNKIAHGELDISNVSSIVYARHCDNLLILPEVCVCSDGAVQSILLVSKKPIENLTSDKILLTAKSETSHCLLKIILQQKYHATPEYSIGNVLPTAPVPENFSAALLIGDDALWTFHHRQKNLFYYDLGVEWKKFTGLKMVYALWVANKNFAKKNPKTLQEVLNKIKTALSQADSHKSEIIESVLAEKNFTYAELDNYLCKTIRWKLSADYLEGLKIFYKYAHELNLIDAVPELNFLNIF